MYGQSIVRESVKKQLPCLIEEMDKSTYIKTVFINVAEFHVQEAPQVGR